MIFENVLKGMVINMKKNLFAIIFLLLGAAAGGSIIYKLINIKETKKIEKFKGYYQLLNQWLILKQEDKLLAQYFIDNNYKTVAIYGMGELGKRFYAELKNNDKVQVKYAVDQNTANIYAELKVLTLEDKMPKVDVIVVTATFAFYEIEKKLSEKVACPIVSLEEIVSEI